MAKSLSLTELTALYANKGKNPKALFEYDQDCSISSILPGTTTLDKLNKLYFTRQNGLSPLRSKAWPHESEQRTIAICLIIVDTLHHEEIWRQWAENQQDHHHSSDKYQAKLFIHAKYPEKVKSAWVRSHLIDVTFRPEWNSVEVVQALLSTLDTALRYTGDGDIRCSNGNNNGNNSGNNNDINGATNITESAPAVPKCGRFVFATESCLPLYDLQATGEVLFAQDCSWLNAYHTPVGTWEAGSCFRAVDTEVVPPQAVWKSLPGWIVLNRRHAAEIIALTNLLGGWGQQGDQQSSNTQIHRPKDGYVGSYQGTQAEHWRKAEATAVTAASTTEETLSAEPCSVPVCGVENGATSDNISLPALLTITAAKTASTAAVAMLGPTIMAPSLAAVALSMKQSQGVPQQTQTQTALLSAWGRGGTWHERNGSVFAPEEMFFPTVLSLLGYLRDPPAVTGGSGSLNTAGGNDGSKATAGAPVAEVKIAAVTFAEWAKRGDANPIQYDYWDADLVVRMRRAGALFGRKFSRDSVTLAQWERVMAQLSGDARSSNRNSDSRGNYNDGKRSEHDYGRDNRGYDGRDNRFDKQYNDLNDSRAGYGGGKGNIYQTSDRGSHRDQQDRTGYANRDNYGSNGGQGDRRDQHNKRWDDDRYYLRDNMDNRDNRDSHADKRRKY